jgi:hypothetical protein
MGTIWQEPDFLEKQDLFRSVVREAETSERILMVFGLIRTMLSGLGHQAGSTKATRARVHRVLGAIAFLRESLADKPEDPFHAAFKRFYNHLHRQVIDALRDSNPAGYVAAARSIETLISEAHAPAFIGHCLEQSEWREHRLAFVLERLFVIAPKAEDVSAPERTARTDFIPLRLS